MYKLKNKLNWNLNYVLNIESWWAVKESQIEINFKRDLKFLIMV